MKQEDEGSVKFIRLNTGEDIIAYTLHVKKDDIEDEHYIVDMPLKVIYSTNENRNMLMSISLMQWVFSRMTDSEEFKLASKDVLLCSNASSHMTDFYYETVHEIDQMKEQVEKIKNKASDSQIEEDFMDYMDENEGLEMLKEALEKTKNKKILH